MVAGAQQNAMLTAILQHEADGEVQTTLYVGMDAFINAHNAAVDGDVITLSAGQFYLTSISKSVSVYGTGFEADNTTGTDATTLVKKDGSNMQIGNSTSGILENVHLEGLRIKSQLDIAYINGQQTDPVNNLTVAKCYIEGNIAFINNVTDANISQCVITGGVYGNSATYLATNLTICNCHIGTLVRTFATGSSVLIDHCIIGEGFTTMRIVTIRHLLGRIVFSCWTLIIIKMWGMAQMCTIVSSIILNGIYLPVQIAKIILRCQKVTLPMGMMENTHQHVHLR